MSKIHKRCTQKHQSLRMPNKAYEYLDNKKKEAKKHFIYSFSQDTRVVTGPDGSQHVVKLSTKECTCEQFQDMQIPCRHAI